MSTYVLVLAGGFSYERDVSLRSGRRVVEALNRVGYETALRDPDTNLIRAITQDPPEAAFLALHGATGENGALRGVLDWIDIAYVGSSAHASRIAWDKPSAKAKLRNAGLLTPDWLALPQATFRELGAQSVLALIRDTFGLPVMVKPAQGGSGLGAVAVHEKNQLTAAMVGCFGYGDTALVERHVAGTNVAVSVIEAEAGLTALPAVEIVPAGGVYDYAARYEAGLTTWYTPARLKPDISSDLTASALTAHRALGLRDLSRVDAVVDAAGKVHVLGVNVAPGLTETSLLPIAVAAANLQLGEVLGGLVERAKERGAATGAER